RGGPSWHAHRRHRRLPGRQDGRTGLHRLPVRRALGVGAPHPGGADDDVPRPVGTVPGGAAMTGRTLVAGIGNVFLGDDGFGVEVVTRLAGTPLPDGVRVVDYGIRGMHLAYDLAGGYDAAILVDAVPRGEAPGTVYVIEPELTSEAAAQPPQAPQAS